MSEIMHNKLVRDKIPEIIEADGATPVVRELADDEYGDALRKKLCEEAAEVDKSHGDLREYADVLTVLKAAVRKDGFTWEQVEQAEIDKTGARGGFYKKIFLEKVILNSDKGK